MTALIAFLSELFHFAVACLHQLYRLRIFIFSRNY